MKRNIPDIHDFASQKNMSAHRVMDFTTNANPLGPSSRAKNAIRKSIKMLDRPCDRKVRYLVRAIARSRGVEEKNIAVSCDPGILVTAIARFFNVRTLLVCSPYPSYYRDIVEGPIDLQFMGLDEKEHFRFDVGRWERSLSGCDAAIIPHPSFVAGKPFDPDDRERIMAIADNRKILLIVDETLIQYSQSASLAGDIIRHPQCLAVSSLSEFHALAGLPVSYCIGEETIIAGMTKHRPLAGPSTLAAAAATESLRDRSYPVRTRGHLARECAFIDEALKKIPGISFYMTDCSSFVIEFSRPPSKPLDTFSRYNILIDVISDSGSVHFPVKSHKWNARYLKTLKNIMGE